MRAPAAALAVRTDALVLFAGGFLVSVAACGGSAAAQGCRKAGEHTPSRAQAVTVEQAAKRQGELVSVSGAFFARDGKPQRICSGLVHGSPPRCREPSLRLAGVRDLAAFDHVSSSGHVEWVESATVSGRVVRQTLRFELSCATEHVQQAFRDRTGETLTLNMFGSNAEVERLDFAKLPKLEPARLRRRYGYFALLVRVRRGGLDPLAPELKGRHRDADGIVWLRNNGEWYAVKRYGPDLSLGWLAGTERRVDARWRRLDGVLAVISRG